MKTIAAKYIIPVTSNPIINGYITIDNTGMITEIGELNGRKPDEYYKGLLCPGFTNAHCHVELSHMKGLFKEASGMSGFINQINALRLTVDKQQRIIALEKEMDQMYNQGIEALGDISNCDESFECKAKSKMYSRTYIELFGTDPDETEHVIESGNKIKDVANKIGIDAALTPHSCYTSSASLISRAAQEGLKYGFISYHNQESPQEEELLINGTGELAENYKSRNLPTPPITGKPALFYFIECLKRFSKFPVNGKIMLVHNTVTNEESIDYALSSLSDSYWTICPLSNIFIHRMLPPINLMRSKGLAICIGTDSLSSNKTLSIVEELKCLQNNFSSLEMPEMLKWATYNGAKALCKERQIGSFEIGKRPGVVAIEHLTEDMRLTPNSFSKRII